MYQIILSSKNEAKKQAVIEFFTSQNIDFEIFCFEADSGVSKTPNSDEEGILGCLNRIKSVKKILEGSKLGVNKNLDKAIFIGMEGIINTNPFGTFLGGWVCLEIDGENFFGCSARCQLPKEIVSKIETFRELSDEVKILYPQKVGEINKIGTNGILTNSLYTRVDEFRDAIKCSWGVFAAR